MSDSAAQELGLVDLEIDLSDTERQIRDTAHRFAAEVMRPIGEQLDRMADPADVIASDSPLWTVFDRARELGLDDLGEDASLTPEQRARIGTLISEEQGWGDAGLAISFGAGSMPRAMALMSGKGELIERFAPDRPTIGCWAITEPDHGSDMVAFDAGYFEEKKPNCVAHRDGDNWVITGQKAAWVSNATIAESASLWCAIDEGSGVVGGGVFLVPLDETGVSRGKPLDKIGQRPLNQGELFFDEVSIPASYQLYGPAEYSFALELILTLANAGMGQTFVGLARAALEEAITYAKQRTQGGLPIIRHQNVKAQLFDAFVKVESARALVRRVARFNSATGGKLHYSIAAKVMATQTAFEVASTAIQIHGGNGLTREYPVEKMMRDARASMIEDGNNDLLSLVGADRL